MKAVLFDLDGTLLDTSMGVIESAIFSAKELGYDELPRSIMMNFIGPPIQKSFIKYYRCTMDVAQKAANIFRSYYIDKATNNATVYPGVYEVMEELIRRKIKIAIASYKREDCAIKVLKNFKLDKFCSVIHGADNLNKLMKEDIINICLKELFADRKDVVFVGDTKHDAIGAFNAGISFIGVTYGMGFRTKSEVDEYVNIGSVDRIIDILNYI